MTSEQAWAEVLQQFQALFHSIIFGVGSRLAPVNLIAMLVVMIALYYLRKPTQSFFAWAFPKSIYRTSSFWVDVKLLLFNYLIKGFVLVNFAAISAFFASIVMGWFGGPALNAPPPNLVLVAIVILLVGDFGTYTIHRAHHEVSFLWPLHSVHHSAEVLNPVTAYRTHPLYDVLSILYKGILIGAAQGLILALAFNSIDVFTIAGVNFCYALFNFAASNLRHTHIWLSFGRVIEHIIISPAQHQIHHSLAPKHINKNYGEVLAIWDWMFGTLYIPEKTEYLEFGISDGDGNRIEQPHPTFIKAIIVPIKDMGAIFSGYFTKD